MIYTHTADNQRKEVPYDNMYHIKRLLLPVGLVLMLIPSPVYCLMNMEVFSGYTFAGQVGELETTNDASGLNSGFRFNALYRIPAADFGLGGFMQAAPLRYSIDDKNYELFKLSMGIDTFIRYKNDSIPVYPYVRYGLAIYDKSETKLINSNDITINEFRFKASYYGIGVSYPIVPMPVIDVHVFLEYLYDISQIGDDSYLRCNKINIGMFMSI
ncbi:MAG: hypothetical protein ACOC2H_02945 [Spirochaetota bacterium]